MTYQEILPYCLFFKGEVEAPASLSQVEQRLWNAEKMICEECSSIVNEADIHLSLAEAVYAYIGKWYPYKFNEMMDFYLEKRPELKDKIKRI